MNFTTNSYGMWATLIVSVILGAFGQIFMKEAMKSTGPVPLDGEIPDMVAYFISALFSFRMIMAVISYGLSFLLWITVLSVADLSLARPVVSLGYLITLGYGFYAGETITLERVIGTALIIAGLFFIARSSLS